MSGTKARLKRPPMEKLGSSSSSENASSRSPRLRPPLQSYGSSSSLPGLEQAVPSFREFVTRTPLTDRNKPLLATPSQRLTHSYDSIFDLYLRRSSSVYSRTPSTCGANSGSETSCRTEDLGEPALRPISYSTSTPDLRATAAEKACQEPRTFAPLIASPSPTLSAVTVHSLPSSRPHNVLQSPVALPTLPAPKSKAPTVSLEEAKRVMHAPGAVRLLPEELRAQALQNTPSQGHLYLDSIENHSSGRKIPSPTKSPIPIAQHDWTKALASSQNTSFQSVDSSLLSRGTNISLPGRAAYSSAFDSFTDGTGSRTNIVPISGPVAQDMAEPRGRWMIVSQHDKSIENSSEHLAQEYRALLDQQPFQYQPASSSSDSDDSIKMHMKMAPQPLFHGKARAISATSGTHSGSEGSISPFTLHRRRSSAGSETSVSSGKRDTGFVLRLSTDSPDLKDSRTSSRTGMIPISPPSDHGSKINKPPPSKPGLLKTRKPTAQHDRGKSRESEFYPHIMRRKCSKRPQVRHPETIVSDSELQAPGGLLLAADILALRLETPESIPERSSPAAHSTTAKTSRQDSGGGASEKSRGRLYRKLADGMRSRRWSCSSVKPPKQDISPEQLRASTDSPHLLQSPVKTAGVHLGWSETAKRLFDAARMPISRSRPRLKYAAAPPRLPDATRPALAEPESPSPSRRPSLFGDLWQSWREDKSQKRREDLKKLINVVPSVDGMSGDGEIAVARRPSLGSRRWSSFNWV